MKREDPNFVPPTSIHAQETAARLLNGAGEKRGRDDRMDEDMREPKRERVDDDDGEEMEIEDDEEVSSKPEASGMLRNSPSQIYASDVRFQFQALLLPWYNIRPRDSCAPISH